MVRVFESFRPHPELEPTGKVSLLGDSLCSAEQIHAYARRRNPKLPEVAEQYVRIGQQYGIRGDVAYCQLIYETRGWIAQPMGPYWEPSRLGHWAEEAAIKRQFQVLYRLATQKTYEDAWDSVLERVELQNCETRTTQVICWEDLRANWCRPNDRYGQDIAVMWRNMLMWKGEDC